MNRGGGSSAGEGGSDSDLGLSTGRQRHRWLGRGSSSGWGE